VDRKKLRTERGALMKKKRWGKKIIIGLVVAALPIVGAVGFFWVRTGEIPSIRMGERRLQAIRSHFFEKNNVVIRDSLLRPGTSSSCWIAFSKDPLLEDLFSLGALDHPQYTFEVLASKRIVNKVVLFEDTDLGVITPLASLAWPETRLLEIEFPSEYVRLLDVMAIDLDSDGSSELIILWSNYCGGSGASVFPLVVDCQQDGQVSYDTFPAISLDKEEPQASRPMGNIIESRKFRINGTSQVLPIGCFHTDVFFAFEDIDKDGFVELVMAFPHDDWDYHYGPQTWTVISCEYRAGRFVPDPGIPPFRISKDKGWGLPEVHGYSFVPEYGQLFFLWSPSWLEISTRKAAFTKGRSRSIVLREIEKHLRAE